jgi:5,10-methylenetetrahydromethanopterin reductase
MTEHRLSLVVPSSLPPEQLVAVAQAAERSGVGRLWLAEDCFFAGGIAASATALAVTDRIEVACGILGAVGRHPALMAMEVATLLRLHPDRFIPGVGLGAQVWLQQMGIMPAKPLTAVREATSALRALLGGESLTRTGVVFSFDGVALAAPPASVPPIFLGVLNPTALEAAGEIADGVLLSVLASEEYIGRAAHHVAAGAARTNRPSPAISTYAIASISDDPTAARQAVRHITAFYLMAGAGSLLTSCLDIDDWVALTLANGGVDGLAEALDDDLIDRLTVTGTPSQCEARIRALLAAGAEEVVLYLYPSSDATRQIDTYVADLVARLGHPA